MNMSPEGMEKLPFNKKEEEEDYDDDFENGGGSSDLLTDSLGRRMTDPSRERDSLLKTIDESSGESDFYETYMIFQGIKDQLMFDNELYFSLWIKQMKNRVESIEKLLESPKLEPENRKLIEEQWDPIKKFIFDNEVIARMETEESSLNFVGAFLSKHNLKDTDLFDAWTSGGFREDRGIFLNNMLAIGKLEERESGITSALYKDFGIRNFQRYPIGMLLNQYKERDNQALEYGIVMNPTHDENGAFEMLDDVWSMFTYDAKGEGFLVRAIEVRTKEEITKRLISMHRKYGNSHKVSFMFIGGHGTKDSITFGSSDHEEQQLSIDDITGDEKAKLTKVFEDDPTFVLISCSTGQDGGVAQKLSKVVHGTVQAPDKDTGLTAVWAKRDPVTYKIDLYMEYNKAATVEYKDGEKVE